VNLTPLPPFGETQDVPFGEAQDVRALSVDTARAVDVAKAVDCVGATSPPALSFTRRGEVERSASGQHVIALHARAG
jgi:hypothetical protein